ncbi:histidine kinase [Spongiactinospora sp. TRM90649]|uniref:sensor histidine kinase n=1 Tax=Spongiactinospora sp. TRM90649 TaxID=3031114 RepID=UPI0023F686D9|nr:histidine kinase [Spongiactinospora sp. TRM90649]MDF5754919.1 histidine kinase [Spongiactinospora sp. TRM90649]
MTLVAVLCALSVYLMVLGLALDASSQVLFGSAAWIAGSLALLTRRRRPVLVAALTAAADVFTAFFVPLNAAGVPTVIAFYSLGRYGTARSAWSVGVAAMCAEGFAIWYSRPGNQLGNAIQLLFAVGTGLFFRQRSELRARREQHAAESAVRAERRRIARELHDVVAHHISVINVLVGAGRTTMRADPERAEETLVTAERTARQAMAEMRDLLHVLRADDERDPEDHSGVGAAEVPTLIGQARQAGLPAGLVVDGEPAPLPAAVDHAVYRIVQESLTNTRKHAPGARASVRLTYEERAVVIEVLDDGTPWNDGSRDARDTSGAGYGLNGMAERVALCGGQLQTGPRPRGGFRVHARIPLPHAPKSPRTPEPPLPVSRTEADS